MTYDKIAITGAAILVVSYCIKLVGYPLQAKKIIEKKSAKEISSPLFILAFVAYVMWTYYGYLKNDWVIMLGQGIGVVTSIPVLYLLYKYRNNK